MTDIPLISVILPFYNTEKYLNLAIQSIIDQTYSNFELLLLDDGSTDNSREIALKYAEIDPRVKVHHHANMGVCRTLQKGVGLANGKYIARMDGDDIAHPQRFELQVNFLENNPTCVAVGTALIVIDPDGDVLCKPQITEDHDTLVRELLQWQGSRICHPTVMMRTEAVKAVGGYTQEHYFQDVDLFLKLATKGKLANLPERLLWYRFHIASVTQNRNYAKVNAAREAVYNRAVIALKYSLETTEKFLPLPSSINSAKYQNISTYPQEYEAHCMWCLVARESGFYHTSLKYLIRIFQSKPFTSKTYWVIINFIFGKEKGSAIWQGLLRIKKLVMNNTIFMGKL